MTNSLMRDAAAGHWVADGTEVVTAVLTHPVCRVRPVDEPVPAALLGTPAGEIFGAMARMSDGVVHASRRRAIEERLAGINEARVMDVAERWAAQLAPGLTPSEVAYALPVRVVATLLGMPVASLEEVTALIGLFSGCVFAGSTPEQVEGGKAAAGRLRELADIEEISAMVQAWAATAAMILGRDPPVAATRRFLAEPAVVAGQPVAAGEMILVKLDAAPFGAGPHACPGQMIARTIAEVARRHLA